MNIIHKKITDLVTENYVYASVLYYLGIKFYDYSEKTLEQVCKEKNLNLNNVIASLESACKNSKENNISLQSFPIDLVIEYLKHSHYIFIKQKLPYIARLIDNLSEENTAFSQVAEDLKLVFPLFVEEFIHHIYEEEDSLFSYMLLLNKSLAGHYHPGKLYVELEKYSIQAYALDHGAHDDEMRGIRKITHNYTLPENNLHIQIIYAELQAFETELEAHAAIENEILFPKAIGLEKEVRQMLVEKARWN